MKSNVLKSVSAAVLIAALSGCGGGGGDSAVGTASADQDFPVEAVFKKILATSATYSATDSASGNRLSMTIQPNGSFILAADPEPSEKSTFSVLVSNNGAALGSNSTTVFYRNPPLSIAAFNNQLIPAAKRVALPVLAKVNASGLFFSAPARFPTSNDTLTGTWSILGQDGKAFICLNIQSGPGLTTLISFATTSLTTYCFLSDTAGNISGFRADTATNARATINTPVVDRASYR